MARTEWWSRFGLLLAIALITWAAFVSWKQLERHARIREEVRVLEEEAARIRQENQTLGERIGYFSSQEFREQEAKRKLGLKKPDETVVALKEEVESETSGAQMRKSQDAEEEPEKPLYRKWWDLFFNQK